MLCSLMRVASLVTLQPVLSGRAFFGACVCCRVSTRVVQTCAVTCHRPSTTHPSRPPTLEERGGRMLVWSDQGHSYQGQLVSCFDNWTRDRETTTTKKTRADYLSAVRQASPNPGSLCAGGSRAPATEGAQSRRAVSKAAVMAQQCKPRSQDGPSTPRRGGRASPQVRLARCLCLCHVVPVGKGQPSPLPNRWPPFPSACCSSHTQPLRAHAPLPWEP